MANGSKIKLSGTKILVFKEKPIGLLCENPQMSQYISKEFIFERLKGLIN